MLRYVVSCAEGRPDRTGLRFSKELASIGVSVKLLIDCAVAYTMDEVDMVFFGADGVVESGGIINMMGTYQIALVAHSMNKPVYVAAESYKVEISSINHHVFFLCHGESLSDPLIYPICSLHDYFH